MTCSERNGKETLERGLMRSVRALNCLTHKDKDNILCASTRYESNIIANEYGYGILSSIWCLQGFKSSVKHSVTFSYPGNKKQLIQVLGASKYVLPYNSSFLQSSFVIATCFLQCIIQLQFIKCLIRVIGHVCKSHCFTLICFMAFELYFPHPCPHILHPRITLISFMTCELHFPHPCLHTLHPRVTLIFYDVRTALSTPLFAYIALYYRNKI
jgi:hypothetical protein